jgi:hypothetical protein
MASHCLAGYATLAILRLTHNRLHGWRVVRGANAGWVRDRGL